jgi:hypothetical protein
MATIRKRGDKWQVQVRRSGNRGISRSFRRHKDALAWARQVELQIDRAGLHVDTKILKGITLAQLVERYRDTISIKKRGYDVERIVLTAFLRHPLCRKRLSNLTDVERIVLTAFLRHPLCRKRLSNLTKEDFASYRDERLASIRATTLKRELSPLHNLFEVARDEWGLPIGENPLGKLRLTIPHHRRERRLKEGELERLTQSAQHCRNKLVLPIIMIALEQECDEGKSSVWNGKISMRNDDHCSFLTPRTAIPERSL